MADRKTVGLRYCGGCNSRYDRVAAVAELSAQCPAVDFIPAATGQSLALLVCGCSAQCAERDDLDGEVLTVYLPQHFAQAARRLQTL